MLPCARKLNLIIVLQWLKFIKKYDSFRVVYVEISALRMIR